MHSIGPALLSKRTSTSLVLTPICTSTLTPMSLIGTPLLRCKGGAGPSITVAPRAKPRGRSATPSHPSRASASLQTLQRLPAGGPTKEGTFLVNPLAHHRLGKARGQDAVLPILQPLHRRPLAHRGDGQPVGTTGQAGRDGAGPRAVGGIRLPWQILQRLIGCVFGSPRVCGLRPSTVPFFCQSKCV